MKTIEEEKQQCFDNFAISCTITFAQIDEYKIPFESGFNNGVEFAQRWIPVEEDPPHFLLNNVKKLIDPVLVKKDQYSTVIYRFSEIEKYDFWRPINLL